MRSRVRFPVLPWGFFLGGEYSHGDHGLGSLVELRLRTILVLHIHVSPSTSSGQRNCASWASKPQKSVTLRPQPGGETTKSIRDMWWHWQKNHTSYLHCFIPQKPIEFVLQPFRSSRYLPTFCEENSPCACGGTGL
jgi:hypothetical protein